MSRAKQSSGWCEFIACTSEKLGALGGRVSNDLEAEIKITGNLYRMSRPTGARL